MAFGIERECVYCALQAETLSILQVIFSPQQDNALNQSRTMRCTWMQHAQEKLKMLKMFLSKILKGLYHFEVVDVPVRIILKRILNRIQECDSIHLE